MQTGQESDNIPEMTENNGNNKGTHPFMLFLSLFVSPVDGFKKLKSARLTAERVNSAVFFPLLALASAVTFLQMVYYPEKTLSGTLENAISVFISYFITYFLAFPLTGLVCGKECGEKISSVFGKQFVAITISSMVIYYILYAICPFLDPILFFAPLYTVYLIMKGMKGVRVPEKKYTGTVITISLIEIFIPYLIELLFGLMLGNEMIL